MSAFFTCRDLIVFGLVLSALFFIAVYKRRLLLVFLSVFSSHIIMYCFFVFVFVFKEKSERTRPSEHPPVKGDNVKTFR